MNIAVDMAATIDAYLPSVTPLVTLMGALRWTTLHTRWERCRNGRWVKSTWHSTNPEIKAAAGEKYHPTSTFEWLEKNAPQDV